MLKMASVVTPSIVTLQSTASYEQWKHVLSVQGASLGSSGVLGTLPLLVTVSSKHQEAFKPWMNMSSMTGVALTATVSG